MHHERYLRGKSKVLSKTPVQYDWCERCGKEELEVIVAASYVDFMGFPLLPANKYALIHCKNCGHVINEIGFNQDQKQLVRPIRQKAKYPWHWYGLLWIFPGTLLYVLIMYLIRKG